MSATSQYTDYSDLFLGLQNAVRVQTGQTATENQAKRWINIGLQDMHVGFSERFPWAERHAILVTQDNYTTGTLTATKGSTTLTGASTLWNTNNDMGVAAVRVGGKFVIAGGTEVYEVSAVGSDTDVTLTSRYTQTTASGASYEYFEDDYALHADFLRPLDQTFFDDRAEIPLIGRREFRLRYPRNKITGKPRVATVSDIGQVSSTARQRRITFWKPPDDFYSIKYYFVTNKLAVDASGTALTSLSSDTDEPIVPLQYRHLIVLYALYHWYRDKKNDTRSQEAKAEYDSLLARIVGDNEIGARRPQMQPRVSVYTSAARKPWKGSGRRYTTGDRFDQLR